MNSKSRLETALNHKEPDRVPFDLGGSETTGIHITALSNWLAYNGLKNDKLKIFSLATQLGLVEEEILKRFRVDVRCLRSTSPAHFSLDIRGDSQHQFFYDEWGIKWQRPKDRGFYYDITRSPLAGCASVQEIEDYPWPEATDASRYQRLKENALSLKATSEAGIVLERDTGGIFETSWWMRGFENFLLDLALSPRMAETIMNKVLEYKLAYWDKALEEVKDEIVVAAEADDLATQTGLLISKDMYRKLLKPLHQRLFAFIKAKAPRVKLFYHSCGAIYDLIPDLLEVGIDILNPVQVSAAGMDTARIKREFGNDLTLWGGGVDTQTVLPRGTPQEVRDEVKRRLDDLAPGGGFVFSAVHCIQADVPPANIQAMWEALQDYGAY